MYTGPRCTEGGMQAEIMLQRLGEKIDLLCNDNEPLQCDKYPGELVLTPLELIERIAQLVPHHAPTGTATTVCWHRTRHFVRP